MRVWKFRLTAAMTVLALQAGFGPAGALTEEEAILEKGKDDMVIGNYYRAASRLRRLLAEYPETRFRQEALLLLSTACFRSGRIERGREHLEALVREPVPETVVAAGEKRERATIRLVRENPPPVSVERVAPVLPVVPVAETREIPATPEPVRLAAVPAPAGPAVPAPPAAAPQSAADQRSYTVVAGERFSVSSRNALVKKLRGLALRPQFEAEMRQVEVHRLLAGRYAEAVEARARRGEVLGLCRGAFVSRVGGSHSLFTGSYVSAENAQREQRRLARSGLRVEIVKATVPLRVWRVTAGSGLSRTEAEATVALVSDAGIDARLERTESAAPRDDASPADSGRRPFRSPRR